MSGPSYIHSEFERFRQRYPAVKQLAIMRDGWGIYALTITNTRGSIAYFCAKNSTKGNIISVHKKLFDMAYQHKHPIIMSIGGTVYKYNAIDIAKHSEENEWHNTRMVNFNISLGERLGDKPNNQNPELFNHPVVQALISTFGAAVIKGGG